MADVEPLRALHYDPAVAGPLQDLAAPPYDVIDPEQRAELAARSPLQRRRDRPARGPRRRRPLRARRRAARALAAPRARSCATTSPRCGRSSRTTPAPDGRALTRHGFFARVRVEDYGPGAIRPHERTHPGPKEDRLRLTRATRANLSPIFCLYSDPELRRLARARAAPRTRAVRRGDRRRRHAQPPVARRRPGRDRRRSRRRSRDAELLIADGHHRYETARVYAEEIGGEGAHRYVLMCLVALRGPGPHGLPHAPPGRRPEGRRRPRRRSATALREHFDIEPDRPRPSCARPTATGRCRSATWTATSSAPSA